MLFEPSAPDTGAAPRAVGTPDGSPLPQREGADSRHAWFTVDARGRIAGWSPAAETLYGFAAYEVIGRQPTMLVPPELDFERNELLREVLNGRPVAPYETERVRKDGSRLDVAIELTAIREANGRIAGARAEVREIGVASHSDDALASTRQTTRREQSRRRLAEAQERFRIAFVHAPNGIALLSTAPGSEGSFLDANPALARQLGYDGEDLIGRCLLDFLHPENPTDRPETMRALLAATEADARAERRFVRGDGRDVWLQIGASVVRDDDGRPLYAVAHLQDVTDARRHEAELRHLADHDGLTGLANRRCFGARLDAALAETRRSDRTAAVLVLDLDNFKAVNDTSGHAVGDELLRRVAAALRSRVRTADVVARLGGDEFGILLTDVTPDEARAVAAELLAAVDREAAVTTADRSVRVTASVGLSTLDASTRVSAEALLSDADSAMYEAKRTGRNRFAISAEPERRVATPRRRRVQGIDLAAASGRLELWEQPLLDLNTGARDRTELLARMRGLDGDAIPAGRFLPVFKRFGRVQDVDRWVLGAAVALVADRGTAGPVGAVEINLDATSIADADFVESIRATLDAAPVDPSAFTFAVTAAAGSSNLAAARRLMASLSDLGCHFALDHFGASAGSLRDLKHLPFDVVKIDGELIAELPHRHFDQLAVRAIADIARGSGLMTVAEHVADDVTVELLRGYGIDYAQGFHIALPRPAILPGELVTAA